MIAEATFPGYLDDKELFVKIVGCGSFFLDAVEDFLNLGRRQ